MGQHIREQQASSLTVAKWCEQQQISKTQFYYWRRQLAEQIVDSHLPDIVLISSPANSDSYTTFKNCTTARTYTALSTLKLTIGDITLEITEDTSDFLLAKVIKAVSHA